MRKSSPHSSRDTRPGSENSFKKTGFNKDAKPFKKNYDGRQAATGDQGAGRPSRSARPYSGRVTDSDKPEQRQQGARGPFGKPSFGKDRPAQEGDTSRKPRKEFDKPYGKDNDRKPFGDRPKRAFDKPFDKDRTDSREDRTRKTFDKPYGKDNDRKPFSDRPKRSFDKPFDKDRTGSAEDRPRKPFDKPYKKDNDRKPFSERPKRPFDKPFRKEDGNKGDFGPSKKTSGDSRPFRDRPKPFAAGKPGAGKKGFDKKSEENKPEKGPTTFSDVVNNAFHPPKRKNKPGSADDHPGKRQQFEDQVYGELEDVVNEDRPKKPFEPKKNSAGKKKHVHDHSEGRKKKYKDEEDDFDEDDKEINQKDGARLEMPLNKFIAHSGECSRRDAAELVKQGKVKVNEELVLDPGYRVQTTDKVTLSGKKLTPQKDMVYILLNKPKGFITTNEDPQGRKTVMQLVGNSGVDRLFPVGRLDRDTSGLLLITNDGELTQKLCHPAFNIKKVYQVTLDKPLTKADFEKIIEGVELEDGKAIVDAIAYLEKKNELGLEIHSGRNRIVRRIFESLGYVVDKLDRVMYAGLTKKNLPRSKWRYLDEREVVLLKHFKQ